MIRNLGGATMSVHARRCADLSQRQLSYMCSQLIRRDMEIIYESQFPQGGVGVGLYSSRNCLRTPIPLPVPKFLGCFGASVLISL